MLFSLYDTDKSKTLTMDELIVLMSNALTALMLMEGKEAPSIHEINQRTQTHFKSADADNDKRVNFAEFKNYLK